MKSRLLSRLAVLMGLVALVMPTGADAAPANPAFRVLVFSKTLGFRHASIADGHALIEAIATTEGFAADSTEEAGAFTQANLSRYAAVVFLSTSGDVLDQTQQASLESYIRSGGGWVGVHSAADTEYGWPWYGRLLGGNAWFRIHPPIQDATLTAVDTTHPSTAHYPPTFGLRDEWYNFQNDPRDAVSVLVTIDENSYDPGPGAMGAGHPIAWHHHFEGGRAWYTAMGHRSETYADAGFAAHLRGGILWAAGFVATPTTTTTSTLPTPSPVCGNPVTPATSGTTPSDALAVLQAAVGAYACPACVCDVDASGAIEATDALLVLRSSAGLPADLACEPCS